MNDAQKTTTMNGQGIITQGDSQLGRGRKENTNMEHWLAHACYAFLAYLPPLARQSQRPTVLASPCGTHFLPPRHVLRTRQNTDQKAHRG